MYQKNTTTEQAAASLAKEIAWQKGKIGYNMQGAYPIVTREMSNSPLFNEYKANFECAANAVADTHTPLEVAETMAGIMSQEADPRKGARLFREYIDNLVICLS